MHERPGTVLLANPTEVKQMRAGTRLQGRTSEIQRRGQTGSKPEAAQHHVVGLETHRGALRDSDTGSVKWKRNSLVGGLWDLAGGPEGGVHDAGAALQAQGLPSVPGPQWL